MILQNYITDLYYGFICWNHISKVYCGIVLRRYITADTLPHVYYGRCITAGTLWQIYYRRYSMADVLWLTYYGRYITAIILWQIWYSTYVTADILRPMYYGIYTTADILRTTETAISPQICSARSGRLLHPSLLVATHHPREPRDLPDSAMYRFRRVKPKDGARVDPHVPRWGRGVSH